MRSFMNMGYLIFRNNGEIVQVWQEATTRNVEGLLYV